MSSSAVQAQSQAPRSTVPVRVLLVVSILLATADLCISFTMSGMYGENSVWMTPGLSTVTILYSLLLLLILQVQLWKSNRRTSKLFEPCTASSLALWIGWVLVLGWFGTFLSVLINTLQVNGMMRHNVDTRRGEKRRLWVQGGLEIALALLGMAVVGGIIREGVKALGNPVRSQTKGAAKTYELNFVANPSNQCAKVRLMVL